jgi:hypothetical protein
MSGRGGIKMVAVDAVVVLTEDAVRDEVRTTLDRPVQWKSICTNLGTNVFDYGQKSAADQMQTSWENLVQYAGTNYGQDIINELQNKITVILVKPVHTDDVLTRHGVREFMIRNGQLNIQRARKAREKIIRAAVDKGEIWMLR